MLFWILVGKVITYSFFAIIILWFTGHLTFLQAILCFAGWVVANHLFAYFLRRSNRRLLYGHKPDLTPPAD